MENYRDTEASALAILTSGNGLELLYSKAVPRWGWVAFWTAFSAAMFFIPGAATGAESYFDTEFGHFAYAICFACTALLTLVSPTGRAFVHLFQWWFPANAVGMWFGVVFEEPPTLTVNWALAGFWGPVMAGWIMCLWFRKKLFLAWFVLTCFLGFALHPALTCVRYETFRCAHFTTYTQCFDAGYENTAPFLYLVGSLGLVLFGRKLANDAWAGRAARASRELHRHALPPSLPPSLSLSLSLSLYIYIPLSLTHTRSMLADTTPTTPDTQCPAQLKSVADASNRFPPLRSMRRSLWREELSKVAASPEVIAPGERVVY